MVKYFFAVLCALIMQSNLQAQNFTVSDSASWHHSMPYGSFHSYVIGDTIIQTKAVKIIRQEALVKEPFYSYGLRVYDLSKLYLYSTPDTTFVYNHIFNRFTPLYVFNVNEGDTVCLPYIESGGGVKFVGNMGDSLFCFVIDSIRIKQYDTTHLKTYYTRCVLKNSQIELNWGSNQMGAYAQRVGAIYTGLIPICASPQPHCAVITSDNSQSAGKLRCYSDENDKIQIDIDCANGGISTAIANLNEYELTIAPIPASNKLYITLNNKKRIKTIDLYNTLGQKLINKKFTGSALEVSELQNGIYYLKLTLNNDVQITKCVIVQH